MYTQTCTMSCILRLPKMNYWEKVPWEDLITATNLWASYLSSHSKVYLVNIRNPRTVIGTCTWSYLATHVFIGNLPATGRGWVIIKLVNDEWRSTTNKPVTWYQEYIRFDDINYSALDHASRAPQLMSCNYMYLCTCTLYIRSILLWGEHCMLCLYLIHIYLQLKASLS